MTGTRTKPFVSVSHSFLAAAPPTTLLTFSEALTGWEGDGGLCGARRWAGIVPGLLIYFHHGGPQHTQQTEGAEVLPTVVRQHLHLQHKQTTDLSSLTRLKCNIFDSHITLLICLKYVHSLLTLYLNTPFDSFYMAWHLC